MLVKNATARHITIGPHCALTPGVNDVDDTAWGKATGIALVRHLLTTGDLVAASGDLASLTPDAAMALVRETYGLDLLGKWAGEEKRRRVLDAINAQIDSVREVIAKRANKKEGDKSEGGK